MSGPVATTSAAQLPRVVLVEADRTRDIFELVSIDDQLVRVRSPFLFEIGEELRLRVDDREIVARVRGHVGEPKLTELEIVT